jgi:hypothetical protein
VSYGNEDQTRVERRSGTWWWIGFTNTALPVGQQALGACIVRHPGPAGQALYLTRAIGVFPHARRGQGDQIVETEGLVGQVPSSWGDPPAGYENRLLSREEAEALAKLWNPSKQGLADARDIESAFLDDDAKPGDPLFRRTR